MNNNDNQSVFVDKVLLQVTSDKDIKTKNAVLQVSSELMENQQPVSPISPSTKIEVVQDSNGKPMIFTIGTDNHLYLIKYDKQAADEANALALAFLKERL